MPRHRAPRQPLLARFRRPAPPDTSRPAEAPTSSAGPPEPPPPAPAGTATTPVLRSASGFRAERVRTVRVDVESAESVRLCYPDGQVVPVAWALDSVHSGRRRRYVADVPESARVVDGMLIRAGSMIVPVRLDPDADDWVRGGAR